jgi:hypothetical protein
MDYDELAPKLQTGDVILFRGNGLISWLIELLTNSVFSHIGTVFREPGSTGPNGLFIWQSFEPEGGVVLDALEPFLVKYISDDLKSTFVIRLLAVERTPAMIAALRAFMPKVMEHPFPSYVLWIGTWFLAKLGFPTSWSTFYCSELVAQSFMEMGLLPPKPYAPIYTPGRFSTKSTLPRLLNASFGPELSVVLPPRLKALQRKS